MHIFFASRGQIDRVNEFMNELSTTKLPFIDRQGNQAYVQVIVQPMQFWSVVFPDEYQDAMLTTLFKDGKGGKPINEKHEKFLWPIRKALGVDKIPEYKTDKIIVMVHTPADIEMIGLGIKRDYWVNPSTG